MTRPQIEQYLLLPVGRTACGDQPAAQGGGRDKPRLVTVSGSPYRTAHTPVLVRAPERRSVRDSPYFMLPTGHLLAFAVTSFVLIVVPGPSVLFTVSRALTIGRRGALLTVLGNAAGAVALA
jgi:hypothetical protein